MYYLTKEKININGVKKKKTQKKREKGLCYNSVFTYTHSNHSTISIFCRRFLTKKRDPLN